MNIFIVHSGSDWDNVVRKRDLIRQNSKKANVLLLEYRRFWKSEAKRLIKAAQIVLYIPNADSHKSKNIDWELRQAKKQQKAIVILNEGDYALNNILFETDPFTKELSLIGEQIPSADALYPIIDDYESGSYIHLFNQEEIDPEKLFQQYKLFSETSESLVVRRQNVNSFYITANTALITIAATVFTINDNLLAQLMITMVLTLPGILLNRSWLKVMESYSLINSSKMRILGLMEKKLSASVFDAEWEVMSNRFNKKKYTSFSDRERNLPIIFNGLFIVVDVLCAAFLAYTLLFR